MSFKFGYDTFIIFEMPGSSHQRPDGKINISSLFRPSVIRGPCPISTCREGVGADYSSQIFFPSDIPDWPAS